MAISATSHSNFLQVYGGEVVLAYNEAAKLKDRLMNRSISSGKSASFPTYATETAKLHASGSDILADGVASGATSGEKVITIENLLYAAQLVDELDEFKSHYDIRGSLAKQSGAALATQHDAMLLGIMAKKATTYHTHTHDTGYSSSAKFSTIAEILAMIEEVAAKMDNLAVPAEERCLVLRPFEYYQLLTSDAALSRDFNTTGDRAKGQQSFNYLGFDVIASKVQKDFGGNTQAQMDDAGKPLYLGGVAPGQGANTYSPYVNTAGGITGGSENTNNWYATAFHKGSAGTVTLRGVKAEVNYIPERNANLLNTKVALGVDVIRPEGIVMITADN